MKKIVQQIFSIPIWLFFRLPTMFSLVFVIFMIGWTASFGYVEKIIRFYLNTFNQPEPKFWEIFVYTAAILVTYAIGFLIIYNISALISNAVSGIKPIKFKVDQPVPLANTDLNDDSAYPTVKKIGIVLAGGGAKGAFQAGAMKAIYRFLEEKGLLSRVKVIAGTSIGSWNALFWLAGLVRPNNDWDEESPHQNWWKNVSSKTLVAPDWYFPFCRNSFLTVSPWKRLFDRIFRQESIVNSIKNNNIHFYFTRSNVESGKLECTTNDLEGKNPSEVEYTRIDPDDNDFLDKLRDSVFASMDLPPLFPYEKFGGKYYEDGGVIDNLPISTAAVAKCDLIFVLPLNSDFEQEVNNTSIFARLFRVMEVRQGVLELKQLKDLRLYNELAELRCYANKLEEMANLNGQNIASAGECLSHARKREHNRINIFGVCPEKDFVAQSIRTHEFWKKKKAKEVFLTMYKATWKLLQNFEPNKENQIRRIEKVFADESCKPIGVR